MSKQQRDTVSQMLRDAPFDLNDHQFAGEADRVTQALRDRRSRAAATAQRAWR
jgi:hypothetical protein